MVPVLSGWLSPVPISVELLQGEHFPSCEEPSPGDTYERSNISGLLPFRFLKLLEGMWGSRDDGNMALMPANQQQNPYVQSRFLGKHQMCDGAGNGSPTSHPTMESQIQLSESGLSQWLRW